MVNLYEFIFSTCGIDVKALKRFHDDFFWEFSGNVQAAFGFRVALVLEDNDPRIADIMRHIDREKSHLQYVVIQKSDITKLSIGTFVVEKGAGSDWFFKKLSSKEPLNFSGWTKATQFLMGIGAPHSANHANAFFDALKHIASTCQEGLLKNAGVKQTLHEKVVTPLVQWVSQHQQSDDTLSALTPKVQEKTIFYQMIAYQVAQLCLQLKFKHQETLINDDEELKLITKHAQKIYQALQLFVLNEPLVNAEPIHQAFSALVEILNIDLTKVPYPASLKAVFTSIINKLSADREGATRNQDLERYKHFIGLQNIQTQGQFEAWVKRAPQGTTSTTQGTLAQFGIGVNHQAYALLVAQIKWEELQVDEGVMIMQVCSIVRVYADLQAQEKVTAALGTAQLCGIILPENIQVAYTMVENKFNHAAGKIKAEDYANHFAQLATIEISPAALKLWQAAAPSHLTGKYKNAVHKITLTELAEVRKADNTHLPRAIGHISILKLTSNTMQNKK